MRRSVVLRVMWMVIVMYLISLPVSGSTSQPAGEQRSASDKTKVKRESVVVSPYVRLDDDASEPADLSPEEDDSSSVEEEEEEEEFEDDEDEIVYDQRQVGGETNIRLNIKNFQLQLPESQLVRFQGSDMAQLIRNSVLQMIGLPAQIASTKEQPLQGTAASKPIQPVQEQQEQNPKGDAEQEQQQQQEDAPAPEGPASMLQVNGNNLPAKFFLEISDFLMNTFDNDAVDDKRVETNHNQQMQHEQQHQQHLRQQQPPGGPAPLYTMEEIKIERVENSNNVKNETITISKVLRQVSSVVPANGTALETVSKENRSSSNATRNATATEDRFVSTKPIRLDTLTEKPPLQPQHPKTLREKVIWSMAKGDEEK